jgi:hypothetical protein
MYMRLTPSRQLEQVVGPFPFRSIDAITDRTRDADLHSDELLSDLACVSRRMEDLARELNCLGFFDDDDRPRAA